VTAGIDLALALVTEDLGPTVALAVARHLVVFLKRPGAQAQFSAALALQAAEDKFGALHDWINGHLGDDLSLSVLADQVGVSERSFSRHHAEATGQTPARAIERLRLEAARRLLSMSLDACRMRLSIITKFRPFRVACRRPLHLRLRPGIGVCPGRPHCRKRRHWRTGQWHCPSRSLVVLSIEGPPRLPSRSRKFRQAYIQRRLSSLGYFDGAADGNFNDDTRRAIERWQTARRYLTSGYFSKFAV
jgi:AraC-like DNA-binding protein